MCERTQTPRPWRREAMNASMRRSTSALHRELGPEMDAAVTRVQPRSETWLTASQGCAQY